MDTQQKLDLSSPIVQRTLRLRERMVRQEALTAKEQSGYQWQMWQKSDLSSYTGEGSKHTCKS